tara:strand:- start:20922 stop:22715 length:1794 start_codon:yes stop_codon:yes gene_type:complete
MTVEIIIFLSILAVALVFFVFEIFTIDVTALGLLALLLLLGFLDIEEAIIGFSNKAVLTVAAMFVLSQALVKTGFLSFFADKLSKLGGAKKWLAFGLFLLTASIISGFINNTATVAIFIPLAIQLAKKFRISPSKILIPLSYAAIYGGTLTLIGTSTNLLVSSMVENKGYEPLGMFEFIGIGFIFLVAGTLYNLFVVQKILPSRIGISSLMKSYHMSSYLTEFKIGEASSMIGSTCIDRDISHKYDITILSVIRDHVRFDKNVSSLELKEGDVLLARGTLDNFIKFREEEKVLLLTDVKLNSAELTGDDSVIVEGLVSPGSSLIGMNLNDVDFRKKFGGFVLAIRREGKMLREKIARIVLHFADTLLIFVPKSKLGMLNNNPDIAILQEYDITIHKTKFWWVIIALIPLIMISASFGIVDILEASLFGVVLLLLLRVINAHELYNSINWSVIIMIAAFIPIGIVVERTGTSNLIGSMIVNLADKVEPNMVPYAALVLIYITAVFMTSIISNNSAAIVLVPIAFAVAHQMGVNYKPFIFAVCYGASTCFMTPMGYQTNLMVYSPGGYRFSDFVRAGAPLSLFFIILGVIFIPIFWPFN